MKTFTIQAQFDTIVANQEWYGLTMADKLSILCNAGMEYKKVASASLIAVQTHRKVCKQKSLARVMKRVRKAAKAARATTIIDPASGVAKVASAAVSLLRSLGRTAQISLAYGEVLCLSVEALAYASKEEAVNSAWSAFKAAVLAA